MSDLVVHVVSVASTLSNGRILTYGLARTSDMDEGDQSIDWSTFLNWNWTSAKMNLEIMQAAITAVTAAGHVVGVNDNRKLFGGAGGL